MYSAGCVADSIDSDIRRIVLLAVYVIQYIRKFAVKFRYDIILISIIHLLSFSIGNLIGLIIILIITVVMGRGVTFITNCIVFSTCCCAILYCQYRAFHVFMRLFRWYN